MNEPTDESAARLAAVGSPIERAFLFERPDHGSVILVRHGQQTRPDQRSTAERLDPPLTELGRRQAEAVADSLGGEPISAVYASPLRRARHTGEAIAARRGLMVEIVPEIEEVRVFANLPEGVTAADLASADDLRAAGAAFVRERRWGVFPHGESSESFRERVVPAMEAILARHIGEHVVVACHGGTINVFICALLGLQTDMIFRPAHASVSRVAFDPDLRVIRHLNQVHHLPGELLSY